MITKMPISKGLFTIIDTEDFERLKSEGLTKWFAQKSGKRFYVSRRINGNGKSYLHRHLMNAPSGLCIDHINGDSLDNRKANLRVCSHRENSRNKAKENGYKGVTKVRKSYSAQIQFNGIHVNLGTFSTPSDAARMYDFAAAIFFGDFAAFNFQFSKKFISLRDQITD